jgi:cytochrome c oxidase assembly protein subunit 15
LSAAVHAAWKSARERLSILVMAQLETLVETGPCADRNFARVRIWLYAVAALVFLMVSIGGATRLTGSGLSITEWQPIMGAVPPLTEADWQQAFAKYREIPQYQHVNRGMSLEAFKFIYWWEWTHRFLGRLIGVVFLVPFLYFLATGQIPRAMSGRLAGIFALGALQGALGWYMVSSGLATRIDVSQYRLALHLGLAILIFGALLWVALSLGPTTERHAAGWSPQARAAVAILALMFLQILLGGLVAGLKAGSGYNTWPLMDGQLIPDGLGIMQPWYLNLFENAMTVQFSHRMVAYVLTAAVMWHAWRLREELAGATSAKVLAVAVVAQAALGVWTLLAQVPLALGLAHQAGAAAVFGVAIWHLHVLRQPATQHVS